MSKKNPVLKNAQKLGREQQKSVIGGEFMPGNKICCEWDDTTGKCFLWICSRCQCP
ncbi:hypothetical protein P2W68_19085 [Chryseobacterium arthrosphaerae]|uniref:hypothetical protein n=1 Tax=Chryseobacterium arthrosphaerae TaxID=651561 RepID=UPI0023E164E8|nr:hypothetical protein [Chryseobacterium arthrosphaerae]WES96941.1 hypothetical protein P2W68_19085 [Chryseobacterium arthrosphaerae]